MMSELVVENKQQEILEVCDHQALIKQLFPLSEHPLYGNVEKFSDLSYLMPATLADFTNETDFSEEATSLEICPACFFNTSGTQNRSKKIPFSDTDLERQKAHEAIALKKLNMGPGDGVLSLGAPMPSISGWAIVNGSEAVGARALNSSQVDFDLVIDEGASDQVTFVIGTPLVVKEIGLAIEQEHGDLRGVFPNLKTAVIFGDVLPDNLRQFIKDLWGFKNVYSLYGTVEADVVATESLDVRGEMNLMSERLYFEFIPESEILHESIEPGYEPKSIPIDEADDKSVGEIVISDLSRETLPLLRYRIGDVIQINCKDNDVPTVSVLGRSKNAVPLGGTYLYEMQIEKAIQDVLGASMIEWRLVEDANNWGHYDLSIHLETCAELSEVQKTSILNNISHMREKLNALDVGGYISVHQVDEFERASVNGDAKAKRIVLAA